MDYPVEDAIDSRNVFEILKSRREAYEKIRAHLGSMEFDPLLTCNEWAIAAIKTANPDVASGLAGAEDETIWMAFETWEKTKGSRTDAYSSPLRTDVVFVGTGSSFRTDSMSYRVDQDAIDLYGLDGAYANGYYVGEEYENERKRDLMRKDVIRAARAQKISNSDPFARLGSASTANSATKQDSKTARDRDVAKVELNGLSARDKARREREEKLLDADPFAR